MNGCYAVRFILFWLRADLISNRNLDFKYSFEWVTDRLEFECVKCAWRVIALILHISICFCSNLVVFSVIFSFLSDFQHNGISIISTVFHQGGIAALCARFYEFQWVCVDSKHKINHAHLKRFLLLTFSFET